MNDVTPVSSQTAVLQRLAAARTASTHDAPLRRLAGDRVELSVTATLLAKLDELPDVRHDLVARIRAEILAGTYETQDKIDAMLDRIAEDL